MKSLSIIDGYREDIDYCKFMKNLSIIEGLLKIYWLLQVYENFIDYWPLLRRYWLFMESLSIIHFLYFFQKADVQCSMFIILPEGRNSSSAFIVLPTGRSSIFNVYYSAR